VNAYERVAAALSGSQPDRVPILTYLNGDSPNIGPLLQQNILDHSDVFYSRRLYAGFGGTGFDAETATEPLDDGWTRVTHTICGARFEEVLKRGTHGDYVGYARHIYAVPSDLEKLLDLPRLAARENPRLHAWIAETNAAATECLARGAFVRVVVRDPLYVVAGHVMPEDMALWSVEQRGLLRQCMDMIVAQQLDYLAYALGSLEPRVIYHIAGAEYALPPLMSPSDFDEFVMGYDRPLCELVHAHGGLIYCHSHGKVRRFLDRFVAMGADGLHPLEPVGATGDCDLPEVKATFGDRLCLMGNVQYDDFARLTPAAMRQTVRDAVLAGKPGGRFVLCPSCTPYHNPLPPTVEGNIIAFIEAGLEYGAY